VFLLQFIIFYTFYLLFSASNIYYTVLYLFLQIAYFGLVLSILQYELFTGFLWVTELTVLFIFLILCFYLNSDGALNLNISFYNYFFSIILLFVYFVYYSWAHTESSDILIFNYVDIWDDFYEAHSNGFMTDFYGLFISYYYFNSLFTLFMFLLLFMCSVVCVYLNIRMKSNKQQNIGTYLSTFNFWREFTNTYFFRRQNLSKQTLHTTSTKIFKKK